VRYNQHNDPLSIDKMQLFAASLTGLDENEIAKAKALYINNAITDYKALKQTTSAFGCAQTFFWIIPLFWPILFSQKKMLRVMENTMREKIQNALDVWADDIKKSGIRINDLN